MWLAWRQFRGQTITALAGLALLAIAFAVSGSHVADLYSSSGVAACHAHSGAT